MNIVLTGFMASGKTEISKKLAMLSGYKLVDTDALIVEEAKMSINDIFETMGEAEFRRIEHMVICRVSEMDNTVISTGGGVVLNKENMIALRKNGIIVNLAPDFDVILQRLNNARSTRPLLKNSDVDDIRKRFNDRLPYYADCDLKIEVSNEFEPDHFAKEILTKLKLIQDE